MNLYQEQLRTQTRRHFFGQCGVGIGAVALGALLGKEASASPLPAKGIAPKAKSVIWLHMAGSPSQLDLFDYKPALKKYDGQPCPQEYLEGKRFAFIQGVPNMLASQFEFEQVGPSGAWVSELMPHFKTVAGEVALMQGVHTDQFNHAPAQLHMLTGSQLLGGANIGAWATYGLGSANENLPGFVVLSSGGKTPSAGKSVWGSGFLPSIYQGVQCRNTGEPVLYLSDPKGMDRKGRRRMLDTLGDLNRLQADELGDPETITRIEQYELAYRMQMEVPEVMDISKEPQALLDMYGAKPGFVSEAESAGDPRRLYKGDDPTFANNCVLARRLVENGVRFVQLFDWGWDHHGSSPGESINKTLPIKCAQTDKPIAALIKDLKQRGLLDETLIVWGGEFGRTPMQQNNVKNGAGIGRDHHPYGFTMWMAGGGIKGGQVYGATDDIGYYPVEKPVDVRDIQAMVLHQLGLDPWRLTYPFQGLQQRLIGVEGHAKIHRELLI